MIGPSVTAVAVLVPAHNEETLLGACLASVVRALAPQRRAGVRCMVVVVAHRCTDHTTEVADRCFAGVPHRLVVDNTSTTVAAVRRRAADTAMAELGGDPATSWLLCTDADTTVPVDWVTDILRYARRGSRAVAGLAHIDGTALTEPARTRYAALVASKVHGHTHEHVYGANLAVRADAYRAVGGFPLVAPGEDTALVATLERAGITVDRAVDVGVTTSARREGRASGGLADLIRALDTPEGCALLQPTKGVVAV